MTNYFKGLSYIFKGFSLLAKKGIRRFVVIPLLINITVFTVAIKVGIGQFEAIMGQFLGWLPGWLSWVEWLLWPLFAILIIIAVYYTFTVVANLIAAPFNALLAEKIETHLRLTNDSNHSPDSEKISSIGSVVGRTIGSEVKKMSYMIKWLILLLIITVIPVVNVIAPFAWGVFSAWMLTLEYADYPMGNHDMFFKEEIAVLKRNKFASLGLGSGLMLMTSIPVLNFFAMPVGVAGGTAYWVDRLSKQV
jgi:CysZ protein